MAIQVAVIPGDGVGKEVTPHALEALRIAAEIHGGVSFSFTEFPWGSEYYLAHGAMMPKDGVEILKGFDAIVLGAVGWPQAVPDHVSLWGLLIPIRRELHQYINLRPARRLPGGLSPLAGDGDFDFVVVRENSEGEYSNVGGRFGEGADEMAVQSAIFTRRASERAMRYAFSLARERKRRHVTSATKSNGITVTMPFWDEVFAGVAAEHADVQTSPVHIDALAAAFVTRPERFDVVVASNLFGDILTDLGAAIMGSIGLAPSANLNPERRYPSMFEPVHGSAPDIAGRGIANPVGQIWSAKMLLDFFGCGDVGGALLEAIEDSLRAGVATPDVGGRATTGEAARWILDAFAGKG